MTTERLQRAQAHAIRFLCETMALFVIALWFYPEAVRKVAAIMSITSATIVILGLPTMFLTGLVIRRAQRKLAADLESMQAQHDADLSMEGICPKCHQPIMSEG